jgi:hypothetical protein
MRFASLTRRKYRMLCLFVFCLLVVVVVVVLSNVCHHHHFHFAIKNKETRVASWLAFTSPAQCSQLFGCEQASFQATLHSLMPPVAYNLL